MGIQKVTMADASPGRMKAEGQLGDVSAILNKLKDEVAYLQDEVERKGAGFYIPLAQQLNGCRAAVGDLEQVLASCDSGLSSKDADLIPAAVNSASAPEEENDFGKAIRYILNSPSSPLHTINRIQTSPFTIRVMIWTICFSDACIDASW